MRNDIYWIAIVVVVSLMTWFSYEFVTHLNHEQTDCLIQWCSSEPVILGQPWGATTEAHCKCGRILSNQREDWAPIEKTHMFETICPICGPVQLGKW